MNILVFCTFFV